MKKASRAKGRRPRRILVLDVGGSHVKFRVGPRGKTGRFVSGPHMTPQKMTRTLLELQPRSAYDAVSIGYPGLVLHGRITAEPHNLGHGWVHFDFEKILGAPVRVINDAAMQAIGSYAGGRMLFLGLGTGMGATLILEGVVEPLEIGHLPYRDGHSFEDYVGEHGRSQLGNKKWRKVVREVVAQLSKALETDYVVIGGGNAKRLLSLPTNCRLGDNRNAFAGGLRMWQHSSDPLQISSQRTRRRKSPVNAV
ncbi:MAG TPA: ROK family protein [Steroidobacteraceae bacterium]|nr:ROK family protein [Steroidobacteraceae bacterium]